MINNRAHIATLMPLLCAIAFLAAYVFFMPDLAHAAPDHSCGNDRSGGGPLGPPAPPAPPATYNTTCTLNVTPNSIAQGSNVAITWSSAPSTVDLAIDGIAVANGIAQGYVRGTGDLSFGDHTFRITKTVTSGGVTTCSGTCSTCRNWKCTTSPVVVTNYSCNRIVTVSAPLEPDLTANTVASSSGTLKVGSSASFSGNIVNEGTEAVSSVFANQFSYRYEPSGAWTNVSSHNQSSLAIGASNNFVSSAIAFATAGTISVRLCADSGSDITESNGDNNCAQQSFAVANPVVPTVNLSIRETGVGSWGDNVTVDAGDQVELQWSSSNANRCTGDANYSTGSGSPTNGTQGTVTEPSSGSRIYTATCYNDSQGTQNSDTVTVDITPPTGDPTISASPTRVRSGDDITITWGTNGNANCSITGTNGDAFDALTPTGSVTSGAINGETVYTISCDTGSDTISTVKIVPSFIEI